MWLTMSDTFGISFFRPFGAYSHPRSLTHGLRRELHSFAASRLARTSAFQQVPGFFEFLVFGVLAVGA
jgi:hypothetical protein